MRRDCLHDFRFAVPCLFGLMLAGCGGGGGGGGNSSSGAIQYSGNTNAAVITTGSASRLAANVFGGNSSTVNSVLVTSVSTDSPTQLLVRSRGLSELSQNLHGHFRDLIARVESAGPSGPAILAGVSIDDTQPCDSGSVRINGNISDSGTGTLTLTLNNCRTGGDTLGGQASIRVDAFDLGFRLPTDYTVSFTRLSIRGTGISVDSTGSIHAQANIPTNTETVTDNVVFADNVAHTMSKTENLVEVAVYDSILSPNSVSETIQGRVFDSVQGFVDIVTDAPLFFGSTNQIFPSGGQLSIRGDANRLLQVKSLSGTLAAVSLDLDGDGVFEVKATLKWTDLAGPVGADLADDDHDGMHNSWETANGLDPNNPADAALDKDGDGASNLVEYIGGTDANGGSTPPPVNLSLTMSGSQNPATIGNDLFYTVLVRNNSTDNFADNVVVTDTLPAGVTLTSAIPQRGVCTSTGAIVSCNLGRLTIADTVAVTIHVTPIADGVISNNATVATTSFDPDMANNSASSATIIGRSTAIIQNLIDGAAPGAVVPVAAGTYVGNLDFNGKNVTLQSVSGPGSTVLDGGQTTIGPGGGINGFHIIVRSTLAMLVHGSGTLISGNVFEGIRLVQGPNAQAIIGDTIASPTIDRNVFRTIPCNFTTLSVIRVQSFSAPVITNNVFENNPCMAIDLDVEQGPTPLIENNTFVGNTTAIHVNRRAPQTTSIFRNNLVVQNGIGFAVDFGSSDSLNPVWTNNLVFGNTVNYSGTTDQTGISGNISSDPRFVNGGASDYHLQPGSPAIDAGSATGAPAVDLDGSPRPSGAAFDIGAFEAH